MTYWDQALPYFDAGELACRSTGIIKLDLRFAARLPGLRQKWDKPLTVTSCCRTPAHNAAVGGHPRSLHLTENPYHPTNGTMAIDVLWPDDALSFARLAYSLGWAVGLHNAFVHLDLRSEIGLPKAIFTYGKWSSKFLKEDIF